MTAREQWFDGGEAAVLEVRLDAGRVEVRRGARLGVRVSADPEATCPWWGGVSSILGRVEEHLGGETVDDAERARRAVDATAVDWAPDERTLRVISPTERSLRPVPLTVELTVPDAPTVRVRAGAADVHVTDAVGETEIETTGTVDLATVAGTATIRCGAGDVRIGVAAARLRVRGGAGQVTVERVAGPTDISTGAGTVRLTEVHADVAVRLAGGSIEVADVAAGDLELSTGAGTVHVGLREGVDAHLDLHSTAGRARSELPVTAQRGAGRSADPVRIRARTTAGDVLVGPAGM